MHVTQLHTRKNHAIQEAHEQFCWALGGCRWHVLESSRRHTYLTNDVSDSRKMAIVRSEATPGRSA